MNNLRQWIVLGLVSTALVSPVGLGDTVYYRHTSVADLPHTASFIARYAMQPPSGH